MVVFLCIMNRLKLFGMMTKHFNAFFLVMLTYPDMLYLSFSLFSILLQFIRASDIFIQVKIQLRTLIRPRLRLAVVRQRVNQSDYTVTSAKSLISMTQMIVRYKKVTGDQISPLKMINGIRIHMMTMMRPFKTTKQSNSNSHTQAHVTNHLQQNY